MKENSNPVGAPVQWTEEKKKVAYVEVFARMSEGESLLKILKDIHLPSRETFYVWLAEDDKLADKYEKAAERRADHLFDKILEVASETETGITMEITTDHEGNVTEKERHADMTAHRKLHVDSLKWVVARMQPRKYGDKLDLTSKDKELGSAIAVTIVKPKDDED